MTNYEVGERKEIHLNGAFGITAGEFFKVGDPIQIGESTQILKVIGVFNGSITVCPYDYVEPVKVMKAPKPKHQTPARRFTEFGRNKVRLR